MLSNPELADFKEIVEKYVDILFANEEEARAFTGMEPEEALMQFQKPARSLLLK